MSLTRCLIFGQSLNDQSHLFFSETLLAYLTQGAASPIIRDHIYGSTS